MGAEPQRVLAELLPQPENGLRYFIPGEKVEGPEAGRDELPHPYAKKSDPEAFILQSGKQEKGSLGDEEGVVGGFGKA